ncbi:MAG: SprT family zinc-dependent metalloprotease [Pseudomonadota bacterium]
MTTRFRLDDPATDVALRRSARARRLTLRISARDGSVHLTVPPHVAEAEIRRFLQSQAGWLRSRLAAAPRRIPVTHGVAVPFLGMPHPVQAAAGRSPRIAEGAIAVPGPSETAGRRVAALLKSLARDRLTEAADRYAAALRRAPGRITLRDTGSRWGSCTSRGDLMFSWRLVMAPEAVLDYVAAHEAAHLVEMNHSPRFWGHVARLRPDWRIQRDWLRSHGADLLRYDFG